MKKVAFAIAVLLQVLSLLIAVTSSQSIDQKTVAIIDDRRYYFSPISVTILEAISACTSDNMTLTALETTMEYDAVQSYIENILQDPGNGYWTSGTRQYNSWIWSSVGERLTYYYWAAGEPTVTDSTTQANLYIMQGLMYDATPNSNAKFICEQK